MKKELEQLLGCMNNTLQGAKNGYKHKTISNIKLDIECLEELISKVSGVEASNEQALNLDSVMQRVLKWWERLPDNMNGDVSKYQYAYRHFERHWMSLTYREIEKIYGIEHVA